VLKNPTGIVTALLTLVFCVAGAPLAAGAEDFGSPPSGEYPIIYNDHTVYAKPDILKQDRVLAALVKDGHIYVPLRSMFEEMGATVSVSADGKRITAEKPGVNVSVTVDKPEVVVNGESRPLDVPPIMYKGIVLVPVRVLSEALGAYVQWVGSRSIVVVRYIQPPPPATPMPTVAPTVAPTAAPTLPPPVPTPTPTPASTERLAPGFVQAAIGFGTKNYNELSAGGYCDTYIVNGAYEFGGPSNSTFAVKVDYRHDTYLTSSNLTDSFGNQYTRFATIDGGTAFAPVFLAEQSTLDARAEYQVAAPRFYVGVGYLYAANNYGYPRLSGFGAGIEKLPDLRSGINFYGSAFYYPSVSGNYTVSAPTSTNLGKVYPLQYAIAKYDIGLALTWQHLPVYLYAGYSGDRYWAKQNAPIGQIHTGPYVGLGVKL
jgi:hypothetical protein